MGGNLHLRGTRIALARGMATTNRSLTCEVPVFFATSEGQTRRIATRIASVLHDLGFESRAVDVAGREAAEIDWKPAGRAPAQGPAWVG